MEMIPWSKSVQKKMSLMINIQLIWVSNDINHVTHPLDPPPLPSLFAWGVGAASTSTCD